MITQAIIPVHSFVDVITNSSSEIFVAADKSTITAIKKLVENIIAAAGGTAKADDLFTFDLKYLCYNENYDEVYLSAAEIKAKRKELSDILDNPEKYTEDEVSAADEWRFNDGDDGDGYVKSAVIVTVKDKENKSAVAAAKVLSDLTGLFSIDATYN